MTQQSWRDGDKALCGGNRVRIAALDGGRALVVGDGLFGPWQIWMEASKLQRADERDGAAPAGDGSEEKSARYGKLGRRLSARGPGSTTDFATLQFRLMARYLRLRRRKNSMPPLSSVPKNEGGGIPVTEKKEQRAQEMDWENEGGSVKKDEKTHRTGGSSH